MADVSRGSVSSLPGSRHHLPDGASCDQHPDRPAVARVQGETDSFGCEYVDMCQECVDAHRAYVEGERLKPKFCQWCKEEKLGVRPHRDIDEGTSGPVYDVCIDCISAELKRLDEELRESGYYDRMDDDWDDSGDDDDDDHFGPTDTETRPQQQPTPVFTYKKKPRWGK